MSLRGTLELDVNRDELELGVIVTSEAESRSEDRDIGMGCCCSWCCRGCCGGIPLGGGMDEDRFDDVAAAEEGEPPEP